MKQKRIIVTGGSGYVGEELVFQLLNKGYIVINIDRKKPSGFNKKAIFYKYNLLNKAGLEKLFNNVDICIHLAAEVGGVAFANKFPAKILGNNTIIDANTISVAAKVGVKKFIYISTSIVYEKCKSFPLKEEYTSKVPPPNLSYGFGKLMGEILCASFEKEQGMKYSVCRLFNVYGIGTNGIGDSNGHVIPDLINKVKSSDGTIELWGKKGTARSFTHVTDIAKGIIAVMENEKSNNEIFNIASPKEFTLEDIVKVIWKTTRKRGNPNFSYISTLNYDVKRNFANVQKAKKILGWKSEKKMEQGLKEMIQ